MYNILSFAFFAHNSRATFMQSFCNVRNFSKNTRTRIAINYIYWKFGSVHLIKSFVFESMHTHKIPLLNPFIFVLGRDGVSL